MSAQESPKDRRQPGDTRFQTIQEVFLRQAPVRKFSCNNPVTTHQLIPSSSESAGTQSAANVADIVLSCDSVAASCFFNQEKTYCPFNHAGSVLVISGNCNDVTRGEDFGRVRKLNF